MELVRSQYSGNAKAVIKGIGVVTCVYVNPEMDQFWLIDYRIYDPDGDGKSKLDHVQEMLTNVVYQKQLPVQAVLVGTGSATHDLMLCIESLQKLYYCPHRGGSRNCMGENRLHRWFPGSSLRPFVRACPQRPGRLRSPFSIELGDISSEHPLGPIPSRFDRLGQLPEVGQQIRSMTFGLLPGQCRGLPAG
jgi:hypothetical protein